MFYKKGTSKKKGFMKWPCFLQGGGSGRDKKATIFKLIIGYNMVSTKANRYIWVSNSSEKKNVHYFQYLKPEPWPYNTHCYHWFRCVCQRLSAKMFDSFLKPLNSEKHLTLKAPRKILEQTTICMFFCFLFFRENNVWHYMWIVCQADDSHVMSSIISSEKYEKHALKKSSASCDWRFKGL